MNRFGFVAFLLMLNIFAFLTAGNTFAIIHPAPAFHQTPGKFVANRQLPSPEMEILPAPASGSFYTVKRFQHTNIQCGCEHATYSCQASVTNYPEQNGHHGAKKYFVFIYPSHNFW